MINLKDKKILVTGATGGIGKVLAHKLYKLGAKLILSGHSREKLNSFFVDIDCEKVEFDLSRPETASELIKIAVATDGAKLDGMVYLAGLMPTLPIKNSDYALMLKTMNVNFFSFSECVREFSLKKNHNDDSSIVVFSSYASIHGDKGQLAYSASKGAIDSAVMVMGKELCKKGIRVNALRPATVNCDDLSSCQNEHVTELIAHMRTGAIEPDDIADQVAFLLSSASSGVFGRCFDIRGYLP